MHPLQETGGQMQQEKTTLDCMVAVLFDPFTRNSLKPKQLHRLLEDLHPPNMTAISVYGCNVAAQLSRASTSEINS